MVLDMKKNHCRRLLNNVKLLLTLFAVTVGCLSLWCLFYAGCPSAANDVDSPDWAPTVHLGYQKGKAMTEASRQREERLRSRNSDETCTEAAEALLDLGEGLQSSDSEYFKGKLNIMHGAFM